MKDLITKILKEYDNTEDITLLDRVEEVVNKVYPYIVTNLGPSKYTEETPKVEIWNDIYARYSGIPDMRGEDSEKTKAEWKDEDNTIYIYYLNMEDTEDIIRSLLHEYTHSLQDPDREEQRKKGYDLDQNEIEAREAELNWKDYLKYLETDEINENQSPKLNVELEVGDNIIVVNRSEAPPGVREPFPEHEPELFVRYTVTHKENTGHKAKYPYHYFLLPEEQFEIFLDDPYDDRVDRHEKSLFPWMHEWILDKENLNEHNQPELSPYLEVNDVIRVIDVDGKHARMPDTFDLYKVIEVKQDNATQEFYYDIEPYPGIMLNRKVVADLAMNHPKAFKAAVVKTLYHGDTWIKVDEVIGEQDEMSNLPQPFTPTLLKFLNFIFKLYSPSDINLFADRVIQLIDVSRMDAEILYVTLRHNEDKIGMRMGDLVQTLSGEEIEIVPLYHYEVVYFGSSDSYEEEEECDYEGAGEITGEECECYKYEMIEVPDEDGDYELMPCEEATEEDKEKAGLPNHECECDEWEVKYVDMYFYNKKSESIWSTTAHDTEEYTNDDLYYELESEGLYEITDTDEWAEDGETNIWDYFDDNKEGEIEEQYFQEWSPDEIRDIIYKFTSVINKDKKEDTPKEVISEGFFDILGKLFKRPEQKSDTPQELTQYLQQIQDILDEYEIYDEDVSKLVDDLKDSDYIDLVDFPTMIRGLQNKLLKTGNKEEIVVDYLSRLHKSLPKRAKYEKKLMQGQVPTSDEYYDEKEQEKSQIPKKLYKTEKELLQIELLKLQEWVKENSVPVAIIFEGRDTAGKGSTIKKLTEYLDPKYYRIVALGIPNEEEKKNWFERYEKYIQPGMITFFDRSWYNRGIVEPVMGYSSEDEYENFMEEVVPFEKSLIARGVILIKFWLSITQGKQEQRFAIRQQSPLKYWKYSPNDEASRDKWDEYTKYKERVFKNTSHNDAPWVVLDANDKRMSGLNAMRHLLDQVEYIGKNEEIVKAKYPEAISTITRGSVEDLKEQKIDTTNPENMSPDLEIGDRIMVWDLVPDPTPPGGYSEYPDGAVPIPATLIGTVTDSLDDDEIDLESYRGGIKYIVRDESTGEEYGLYRGYNTSQDFITPMTYEGRDKWIILPSEETKPYEEIINESGVVLPSEDDPGKKPVVSDVFKKLLVKAKFTSPGGWGRPPKTIILFITPNGKVVDIQLSPSAFMSDVPFKLNDIVTLSDLIKHENNSNFSLQMYGRLREGKKGRTITNQKLHYLETLKEDIRGDEIEKFLDLAKGTKKGWQGGPGRKKIFDFLSTLRESGLVNMFQASGFLISGSRWLTKYLDLYHPELLEDIDEERDSEWDKDRKMKIQYLIDNADTVRDAVIANVLARAEEKDGSLESAQRLMGPAATDMLKLWMQYPGK